MAYIVWSLLGVVIAVVLGATQHRRAFRPNANGALLGGAFGGLVGGVIGDGVPQMLAGDVTLMSLVGASIGALLFCLVIRSIAKDADF